MCLAAPVATLPAVLALRCRSQPHLLSAPATASKPASHRVRGYLKDADFCAGVTGVYQAFADCCLHHLMVILPHNAVEGVGYQFQLVVYVASCSLGHVEGNV